MSPRALLAEVLLRILHPVLLLASLWILLRGHNEPGGGFVGGLLAVAASAAMALTLTTAEARQRLPLPPPRLTALGVLIALLSGLPGVFAGQPFLTHLWVTVPLAVTELPLSTVMLFDLGVYLAVWGAVGGYCLSLLATVEEQQ
ncbi:MAG TPA: MnhB domain-containing protein [Candidatus Accumulibacter phosphatis]|nr:MAG: Multiple resistance and pH homeostasis protein B [Candidatus Accumulibacter sp. SK-11]HAY28640.1 Na(+)/H(+) antiporter subunit B [Accumulibacter sp.]HCN66806.1 Na(+)/H(+) antiporter subunit B [Accumulibacter sp.]HRL77420.1 MnhB domain-containing protein [Candidatus Accumulibacter phosphatis]HRQ97267.1 MnhB domain-containing protein [Candidatus Accumulibacter phosphatis]